MKMISSFLTGELREGRERGREERGPRIDTWLSSPQEDRFLRFVLTVSERRGP
jgi:hypothetical protein